MLTHPTSIKFWRMFAAAPSKWLRSDEGKILAQKCHKRIKEVAGDEEAETFSNLVAASACVD